MFQDQFNSLKQEIRDLKTGHDMKSTMRVFRTQWTSTTTSGYVPVTIRITFEPGDQPILTTIVGEPELIPLEPTETTQDFILAEQTDAYIPATTFYIWSSRAIVSVEEIWSHRHALRIKAKQRTTSGGRKQEGKNGL